LFFFFPGSLREFSWFGVPLHRAGVSGFEGRFLGMTKGLFFFSLFSVQYWIPEGFVHGWADVVYSLREKNLRTCRAGWKMNCLLGLTTFLYKCNISHRLSLFKPVRSKIRL
jgi:hypothetical protein